MQASSPVERYNVELQRLIKFEDVVARCGGDGGRSSVLVSVCAVVLSVWNATIGKPTWVAGALAT